jgi:peptidoglycan/xylan/chitin deacetylase (PgdA/CDA1 family)
MTVLCYHTIDEGWESPLAVRPADFDAQASWLARHRQVVDLASSAARFDRAFRLQRGAVALTFDDGFRGLYDHALPVLRRLGLPAMVYVVTRTLHDRTSPVDWVRDHHPDGGMDVLDAEQILEMREAGIRFGSHTVTHRDLPELTLHEQVAELRQSREALEDLLHEPVGTVAYPRGLHDEVTREAAHRAGYHLAFALPERREVRGPQAMPRVGVYRGNSLRTLRTKIQRGYLPVRLRLGTPEVRARLSAMCR